MLAEMKFDHRAAAAHAQRSYANTKGKADSEHWCTEREKNWLQIEIVTLFAMVDISHSLVVAAIDPDVFNRL